MDTSESFVTASSHTGSPSLVRNPQNSQEEMDTAVNVQSAMNTVVGRFLSLFRNESK